jgi:hypothetical protein
LGGRIWPPNFDPLIFPVPHSHSSNHGRKPEREIADKLAISQAIGRTHVSTIVGKLHLASRSQVARYVLREGLASLDDATRAF